RTCMSCGRATLSEVKGLMLAASASADPDNDALSYSWDVNGDGVYGDATGVNPILPWWNLQALGLDDGHGQVIPVSVRVTDGAVDPVEASSTLTFSNSAPYSWL